MLKFKVGDIVQLNEKWKNKVGIVIADEYEWYVIKNHWDVAHCICKGTDVIKVITKNAVPKKYIKFL